MDSAEVAKTTEETVKHVNILVSYIEEHIPELIGLGIKVLLAAAFFCLGKAVIHLVRRLAGKAFERSKADEGVRQFTDSIIKFGLYSILVLMIVTSFGVNLSSITTILAAAGVAVSLALQGVISNFAGGVLILTLKPFLVGDYIIEDNNKNEGTVKEIQLFHTKLTTIDNRTIVIPNGMLTNNSLTNVTARDERQMDLRVCISYESDLKKAKELVEGLIERTKGIRKDEEHMVFVDELGKDGVTLGIRAWTSMADYWRIRWEFLEQIKFLFDENGIVIAHIPYMLYAKGEKPGKEV